MDTRKDPGLNLQPWMWAQQLRSSGSSLPEEMMEGTRYTSRNVSLSARLLLAILPALLLQHPLLGERSLK